MSKRSTPGGRRAMEKTFSWRVAIEVPSYGLQNRLTGMLAWCNVGLARERWGHGSYQERPKGQRPVDWSCFYFLDEEAARAFQGNWGGMLKALRGKP